MSDQIKKEFTKEYHIVYDSDIYDRKITELYNYLDAARKLKQTMENHMNDVLSYYTQKHMIENNELPTEEILTEVLDKILKQYDKRCEEDDPTSDDSD